MILMEVFFSLDGETGFTGGLETEQNMPKLLFYNA